MSASARGGDEATSFRPTSGTGVGWLGVGLAALAVVSVLVDGHTLGGARFGLGAMIFGLLVWCFMLRPRLVIGSTDLELRNPFGSWHVPLAGVRRVAVRAVTRVYTDDRHFDGVAVGRPVRSLVRGRSAQRESIGVPGLGATHVSQTEAAPLPKGQLDADMTADFVVEQILRAADRARAASADPRTPSRTWAWPELAALLVLATAMALSLLL